LPHRYWSLDRENPALSSASRIVDDAWRKDQGLLIEGPVGTGKTLAAAVLTHRLLERGARVLFVSAPSISDALRRQASKITVEQMQTVQHLVIDDLGAEFDKSGWWFSILYQIVNERYVNLKPTTATCNSFKQVEPRILRRVAEQACVVAMERT